MEPRIQYAKTKDGVSIAFWTLGQGMPFVQMPIYPWSHTQFDWQLPDYAHWYERMAGKRMLVRFDPRGTGLSDRDVGALELNAYASDLEAVVARLGLESFTLFGSVNSGPLAITYAARDPDRVSHLVLWSTAARGEDLLQSPQRSAVAALLDKDWELYTETLAHVALGWSEAEARRLAAYFRECTTQMDAQRAYGAIRACDVTSLLPRIACPTLVLHRREMPWPTLDAVRSLAARIPYARLAVLEGRSAAWFLGDADEVARAIDEFLGEDEAQPQVDLPSGTASILFADIADSTALTERLGDAAFRERARALDGALRTLIREHDGTPIEGKLLGDGVLAVFTSARHAIEAGTQCVAQGGRAGLPLHVGVHAGDVIREEGNVYGGAVNLAARIADASAPGEVLVSQTVRDLARTSAGVAFEARGRRKLKGVEGQQRLFAVRERE